ncbi:MAG: S-layer homology domain-containing protein [Oscillospiraceae bacterium]|nr:S-layer homology domain-containing protein [Oscillospiraceae bacterium]
MKHRAIATALALVSLLSFGFGVRGRAEGRPPVAENLELETYRGVSVGGCLRATDPDGGPLRFIITTPPGKGTVELGENGSFVYTPEEGRRGKDYFGYKAEDAEGNLSQEATVILKLLKQKTVLRYADTTGSPAAYAAARLAEAGIYVGAQLNGSYVFAPEEAVRREEFLALCCKVAGLAPLEAEGIETFADSAAVSAWARGYLEAAARLGLVKGSPAGEGGSPVFRPGEPITVAEAAALLDRALALTDAMQTWYALDEAIPAWARQSAANLSACGLVPEGCRFTDGSLSRGDAAVMLTRAMELVEKRERKTEN